MKSADGRHAAAGRDAALATPGGLCHNQGIVRERWYSTGLLIALLAVSVSILLVRWNTVRQRVPLAPIAPVVQTATAADEPRTDTTLNPRSTTPTRNLAVESLDLNTASLADLDGLPGIGPVLAGRIISARDTRGGFESVEDLLLIEGIGECKLAGIRELVHIADRRVD